MEPHLLAAKSFLKKSIGNLGMALNYKKLVGMLVKVKDDLSGQVFPDGTVSKKLNENDHGRLNKGIEVATEILRALGCPGNKIVVGEVKGAHPSGTCRIGPVLSDDLETEIANLYVCDASVFPEALDRPTVMTILAFGKRLGRHILQRGEAVAAG
jgi:choline dehydrogenase-like flavoprotein